MGLKSTTFSLRDQCSKAISNYLENPGFDSYTKVQQQVGLLKQFNPSHASAFEQYVAKEMKRRGWLDSNYKK